MSTPANKSSVEDKIRRMTPVSAPSKQRADVATFFHLLVRPEEKRRRRHNECKLIGPTGETVAIPQSILYLLERVTEVLARGDAISVVPVEKELTTQQAANLLNMSRQYLVRLLDNGRIPHVKTGKHRRLKIEDVIAFKELRDKDRKAVLNDLTQMSEMFGGYR